MMPIAPRQTARHAQALTHRLATAASRRRFERFKRLTDVVGALVGLALSAPLVAVATLWIRLADGRPVFYSQWRVGYDGWFFRLYKLRTMSTDAESDGRAQFSRNDDPRILRGCAWIRKSHIDELPQLWNILKGQMSLVGPRPERPEIIESLQRSMPKIERRLTVKPGLTGLAQVCNGYTNNTIGARRKLAHDLQYLRHRSVRREIRLLLATIPKVWDQGAM